MLEIIFSMRVLPNSVKIIEFAINELFNEFYSKDKFQVSLNNSSYGVFHLDIIDVNTCTIRAKYLLPHSHFKHHNSPSEQIRI